MARSMSPFARLPVGRQPQCRDHRRAIRQGGAKGGSPIDPQGFDAGRKVTGRKRRILVDAQGLLIGVSVLAADIQDRDGVFELLRDARRRFPFIAKIFADAGYQRPKFAAQAAATGTRKVEIVKRSEVGRCGVLPKRRIVGRSFAWISRNRRPNRRWRAISSAMRPPSPSSASAMIRIMLKRLTTPKPAC